MNGLLTCSFIIIDTNYLLQLAYIWTDLCIRPELKKCSVYCSFTVQIHCSNDLKSFSRSRNRTIFFSQQVRTFCKIKFQFLKSTNLSHCAVFCCADADTVDVPREHELFDFVIWWLWCWTRECDTWRDSAAQRCVLTKILSGEKFN